MNQQQKHRLSGPLLWLAMFLMVLCIGTGAVEMSAQAATVNIITATDSVKNGTFVRKGGQWMYRCQDGTYLKNCLVNINGKAYSFSAKGYRQYGWQKIGNYYYYYGLKSEGYMYKKRWVTDSNGTYYLQKSGKRAVGWLYLNGQKYYFRKNGQMVTGWLTLGGKKYCFNASGQMYKDTLLTLKNGIFYLQKDGTAATGWKTISGSKYYFGSDGRAVTGQQKIDQTVYNFSKTGKMISIGANLSISSDCAILMDADTGEVLYAKNAGKRHANASTTKILTCILALENCKLTEKVKVSAYAASQEPTKLYMQAGDSFILKDLLYSLMLPSHNDTAVAIAEHVSGSASSFVTLMNKKAKEIGCTNTHFATPNGLDRDTSGKTLKHYTTALDLAKIARYALQNQTFRKIINTSSYSFSSLQGRSYQVSTTNKLLGNMTGICGMKTGYTQNAGYCFVGLITAQNGKTYISVTLGGATSDIRWQDTKTLLQYAYNL